MSNKTKTKSRIFELLSIEANEPIKIVGGMYDTQEFYFDEEGQTRSADNGEYTLILPDAILYAIEYPETVVHLAKSKSKFTSFELNAFSVMRKCGARFACRDKINSEKSLYVYFATDFPIIQSEDGVFSPANHWTIPPRFPASLFPTIKPGNLINIDEVLKGVKKK